MAHFTLLEKISHTELSNLALEIASILNQGQGFRLGESTVISHFIHQPNSKRPEEILIFVNRDAGQELANEKTLRRVIHLDVFHEPAQVEVLSLAQAIAETIKIYQHRRQLIAPDLTKRIYLETGTGSGNIEELAKQRKNKKAARGKKRITCTFCSETFHIMSMI